MTDTIRVVVVDDILETREHLAKLLSFETDIDVVGVAASGPEAIEIASRLNPDVVTGWRGVERRAVNFDIPTVLLFRLDANNAA